MLQNGSFTEGWTDMPPAPGFLINQQPNGWLLHWIEPGQPLFDTDDQAKGVPECVHKLARQLPANEQLGAKDALILVGDTTYKLFHANSPFGAELKQTITGLKPGSRAVLTVPILVVLHGETDPFGAESGVWVNGEGEWINGGTMGNRKWFRHRIQFVVPANGTAVIEIRFKSKWSRPKDFFIDGIELEASADSTAGSDTTPGDRTSPPDDDPTSDANIIKVSVPTGIRIITATTTEPRTVIITVPVGMEVEVT